MGAQTETELKEKKLRVEDALNATKAAVEEGICIGGGCMLLRLAGKVDAIKGEVRRPPAGRAGCSGMRARDRLHGTAGKVATTQRFGSRRVPASARMNHTVLML